MLKAPDLGLPFFYRVLLPGAVVTIAGYPLLTAILSALGVGGNDRAAYLVAIGILLGFILSLLDDPIYQLLEGRTGWPRWLADWRTKRWIDIVGTQYQRQEQLPEDDPERAECWYFLRQFPVDDDGNPTATRPSRIGNVIAAYEQYPLLRYGMDDTFYWPRLWLVLDKEVRNEIDNPWAAVDSILYSGCAAMALGILYLLLAALSVALFLFHVHGPLIDLSTGRWALAGGVALMVVFLVCIRISIAGLVANGENYKSVFDLYRSKLDLKPPSEVEKERWDRLEDQLQYGLDND